MIETARRFLAQKRGSLGTWLALVALALLGSMPLRAGTPLGFVVTLAVFVLASGIVSRDAASGALQMILARPILRAEYLLGRFFGGVAAILLFLASTLVLTFLLDRAAALAGWTADSVPWGPALRITGEEVPHAVMNLAILLFFSTFLRGIGDVLAFLLFGLVFSALPGIFAGLLHRPDLASLTNAMLQNLAPDGAWRDIFHGGKVLQLATGQWVLALAGYLLLATLLFNRRELSYGQD
ncbi:MAG: hypothetical protein ABI592_10880 [Acidobacteriota bacterium]